MIILLDKIIKHVDFYREPKINKLLMHLSHPDFLWIYTFTMRLFQVLLILGLIVLDHSRLTLAVDLYVSNSGDGTISKIDTTGVATIFASGLNTPRGVAFDNSGNLFVANAISSGTVSRIDTSGNVTTFATGLSNPNGLAFDTNGILYVANGSNNTISKITPGGVVTTFATGLNGPRDLAFDSAGDLYVSQGGNSTIAKVDSAGTVSVFVSSGLSSPQGLAFGTDGYLYVAQSSKIEKVATNVTVSSFATGLGLPVGIAFGASGDLFAANNSGALNILQITPGGSSSSFSSGLNSPTYLAFAPVIVPEPSSLILVVMASGVLWMVSRKRSALS